MDKNLIVITGASSGIGRACAKQFSNAGYPLLLLSRRLELMKQLNLPETICMNVDVKDYSAIEKALQLAKNKYGDVDCLINNAGILISENFLEVNETDIYNLINTNFTGIVNAAKVVLPSMRQRKKGTIFNISSIGDRLFGVKFSEIYCATKAAVKSFSESLSVSHGKYNIRCCNVAPGYVETPIWDAVENKSEYDFKFISDKKMAEIILWIYQQPQSISIRDILLTPTNSPI